MASTVPPLCTGVVKSVFAGFSPPVLGPSALLIEVMLVLLSYHWHCCLQLKICRKKPIAQTLIRIDHTLPTDKDLSYSSH